MSDSISDGYCEQCREESHLYECDQCSRLLCEFCYGNIHLVICSSCEKEMHAPRFLMLGQEVQTEYMTFLCIDQKTKTSVWQVLNRKSSFLLGTIRWYAPWRQYVLMPQGDTVFNNSCLTLIMGFVNRLQKGEQP